MTSKERAALRAQANTIEPLFQIGKGGISEALINETADALRKRELIKLKVLLESAPQPPKELAQALAQATQSEVVQVIGGSLVFYKENPELREEKKKTAAKKKPSKPLSKVKAKKALEERKKRIEDAKQASRRARSSRGGASAPSKPRSK